MAKVSDVYTAALSIMDEEDFDGAYGERSIGIINTLLGQCWLFTESYDSGSRSGWTPVSDFKDELCGVDNTIALSVMPYGLAAILFAGEDALRANSWWQIYQEGITNARRSPAEIEPIEDVYGVASSHNDYGEWGF